MPTTLELKTLTLPAATQKKADLLVVLVPAEGLPPQPDKGAEAATSKAGGAAAALHAAIGQAIAAKDLEPAKAGNTLTLYSVAQVAARRVLLVGSGTGAAADISKALPNVAAALRHAAVKKAVVVTLHASLDDAVLYALALGLAGTGYRYTTTKPSEKDVALQKVVLGVASKAGAQAVVDRAAGVATGVAFAKELGNLPPNVATPTYLGEAARQLAKVPGITAKVHGPREITRLKMGAFLAVAQGSAQPPQFIELHYQGAGKNDAPVVLVGKGVTFDTGGISIKPAAGMDEMKFDMCGAASVLGTFAALAKLQPKINVVGLIPATENMPGGKAIKPGDVVTSMSGQTIEILNTDAEGRLILCDALTYADRFHPKAVIDVATLTGACVIALGGVRSGLFASDDDLGTALLKAGEDAQDLGWRMPLDDDYAVALKSNFADVANVGGREAGAVTAAKFLQKFVGDWPWAHLDIAGTAWKSGASKGATGRPVGLLIHYLLGQAGEIANPTGGANRNARKGRTPATTTRKATPRRVPSGT